jgi:hypothetical protein
MIEQPAAEGINNSTPLYTVLPAPDPRREFNKNFPLYQYYFPLLQKDVADLERVQFLVCAFPQVDINFHIRGRGIEYGKLTREEKHEWLRAGGVVTYFSWHLGGYVSQPKTFCGRRWRLEIEDIDFHAIRVNGKAGILGSGYLDEGSGFRVRLQMPPLVTQGLLEQLRQSRGHTETWRLRSIIDNCQETPENSDIMNEQLTELRKTLLGNDGVQTHPDIINIGFHVVNLRPRKGVIRSETILFDVADISFECSEHAWLSQ